MKILLINSPIRLDAEPNCIPYGLATIASCLRQEGFDVDIFDINALRPDKEKILSRLNNEKWDIVGISGLITTYKFQKWLIPELKRINPKAPVLSGGGLATSSSSLLFDYTDIDIAVIGEGEKTMIELCEAVSRRADLSQVRGIKYRDGENIIMTAPRENIHYLDEIPFPAWDLLPMDIYLKNPIWGNTANNSSGFLKDVKIGKSMNIISSRGCPFSCEYCYHLFGRSNYRFRSPENIIGEIEILIARYGVDFIGFVDDNMMASSERMEAFCRLVLKKKLNFAWGCHGRVTSATPETLSKMAEAGCVWIGYGIESGSQKILDKMNKKAIASQAERAIENTRKAGIFPNTTFIFGYPGETIETIQETVDFKKRLALECGSFFATPYPGTPLYRKMKHLITDEEQFIESLGNATEFSINLTDFSDDELFELKRKMDGNIRVG